MDADPAAEPWFDEEIFEALRETVSEEIFPRLLRLFLENTRTKLEEILVIDPRNDADNLAIALHALKGSALMVGARELEGTSEELRAAARRGDAPAIEEGIVHLREAVERVHERVRTELKRSPG